MEPQFRFCTSSDGTRIAYAIYGSGPPLLYIKGFTRSMEAFFAVAESRALLDALAAHTRIITFDRRGTGASARDVDDISFDADKRDAAAVADAAGLADFALFSDSTIGPALLYAIDHRERVRHLILWTPLTNVAQRRDLARLCREDWSAARRRMAGQFFPDGPVSIQRTYSQNIKDAATADVAARYCEEGTDEELASLSPRLTMPTLVLQREMRPRRDALRIAGLIGNGQLRLVPGTSQAPYPGHEPVLKAIFEFMGLGEIASAPPPQGTAIILFTDIADSTALTERMGDAAFRAQSRALDERLRALIREHGGTPVEGKVLGDGVMAVFASAAKAIEAALACDAASREGDLRLHLGIHAGDVSHEENNVYGGAVNIAARVAGEAAAGELLVSETVRALARTSAGVVFDDRGEHALKGIDEAHRLYAVRAEGG